MRAWGAFFLFKYRFMCLRVYGRRLTRNTTTMVAAKRVTTTTTIEETYTESRNVVR